MNIIILGAAGFIGTNLALKLADDENNKITLVDSKKEYFHHLILNGSCFIKECELRVDSDFNTLLKGQDIVYHLVSTTVPATANGQIPDEITANVVMTAQLLEACVKNKVKRIIFLSSGGTVYGRDGVCPLSEDASLQPISSYGLQKVMIEKMLQVYYEVHQLDFRIIRASNPYGPYQKPTGLVGAVTNFTYKALKDEEITIFGDGSVVRDYIFIADVIEMIVKIASTETRYKLYNVGSGSGVSLNALLETVAKIVGKSLKVKYFNERKVDVPVNYLDTTRFNETFGHLNLISLEAGIEKLISFLKLEYKL